MAKAFLIASDHHKSVTVRNFHVNLWFLGSANIKVEMGLLLDVDKDVFIQGPLSLDIYTPFDVDSGSLMDLHETMLQDEVLHLIFNDHVRNKRPIGYGTVNSAFHVDFRSERDFILLRPEIRLGDNNNRFDITIDSNRVRVEELNGAAENGVVPIYVRLRYSVNIDNTESIYFERGALRHGVLYDFRFNELRTFVGSDADIYTKIVPINQIYVFIIKPYKYRVLLDAQSKLKYIRLLETESRGWRDYIQDIAQYKEKYLIYYWRENRSGEKALSAFNLLVSFDAEQQGTLKMLGVALLLMPTSLLVLALPQYVDLHDITTQLASFLASLARVLGGVGVTLAVAIAANAIWDYMKSSVPFSIN